MVSKEFFVIIITHFVIHIFRTIVPLSVLTELCRVDYIANLSKPNINPFNFSTVAPGEIKNIILSINQMPKATIVLVIV